MKTWQRVALWIVGAIVAVALLAAGGFVIWGMTPQGPSDVATAAMVSGGGVTVAERDGVYYFSPESAEPTAGVIFYPGGHVDARSYAPLARAVASQGVLVAVPKMPLSVAFLRVGAAGDVMEANPGVKTWILAGHSLGGIAATQFASASPEKVDGLALLASYPASGTDLSSATYPVVLVRGTEDGLVSKDDLSAAIPRLPGTATMAELDGGNHAQFGSYGEQRGDKPATITPEEQTEATADAIMYAISQANGR